jgi:hypothetical protein
LGFYLGEDAPACLLAIIDKTDMNNISAEQRKQLGALAKAIKDEREQSAC